MKKVRKYLDQNYYHLYEEVGTEHKWKLFEKHDGWLFDGSEPIMTSETHSYDDLLKFVKTHRALEEHKTIFKVGTVLIWTMCALSVLNSIFWHKSIIGGFVLGVDLVVVLNAVVLSRVSDSKLKLSLLRLAESEKRLYKAIKGDDNEND